MANWFSTSLLVSECAKVRIAWLLYLCRVTKEESLYRGYCPGGDTREAAEVYCNCMEGEVVACQEGLDFMACEEIEKRKGKSKYKKGKIQAFIYS